MKFHTCSFSKSRGNLRMVKYLNQKGFSLTEVLVVVAIVGILITIAVPQYEKARRKSMQTEAKVLLSKIYSVEALFINEWKYGTPNFLQMGFYPEDHIFYNAGWPEDATNIIGDNINEDVKSSLPTGYGGPYVHTAMIDSLKHSDARTFGLKKLTNIKNVCENASSSCQFIGTTSTNPKASQFDINSKLGSTDIRIDNTKAPVEVKFAIGARGYFTGSNSDEWIIDHNKELKHIKNGI